MEDNNTAHRAFPMTFDFAEGNGLANELFEGRVIENVQDLNTILVMLEGDAPKDGHGYRKVFFFTQGYKFRIDLQSDCSIDRQIYTSDDGASLNTACGL